MTEKAHSVSVKLLEKEFRMHCALEEEAELLASADYLNAKMSDIRKTGKLIGIDKIALMAAMNITHEFLKSKNELKEQTETLDKRLSLLQDKVNSAVIRNRPMDKIQN